MTLTKAADKIFVLIVDDHPLVRAGIRTMLDKTPDICVVAEADCGQDAEKLLDEFKPKVMLLDLRMPGFSPLAFEKWAREKYPEIITLVLTAHDRDAYLAGMIEAGAVGYLDKELKAEQLIEAIRNAAGGKYLITSEQMVKAWQWRKEVYEKWEKMTKREREVLLLVKKGLSNKAIAEQLGITLKTVAYHVSAILDRLDVESRQEATLWYEKCFPGDLE